MAAQPFQQAGYRQTPANLRSPGSLHTFSALVLAAPTFTGRSPTTHPATTWRCPARGARAQRARPTARRCSPSRTPRGWRAPRGCRPAQRAAVGKMLPQPDQAPRCRWPRRSATPRARPLLMTRPRPLCPRRSLPPCSPQGMVEVGWKQDGSGLDVRIEDTAGSVTCSPQHTALLSARPILLQAGLVACPASQGLQGQSWHTPTTSFAPLTSHSMLQGTGMPVAAL